MNNSAAILRGLITYAICIPLAIFMGAVAVSLAYSPTYANFGVVGILALILSAPILLRWHHPLLILSWNLPLTIFFVRGSPLVYLLMVMISLGISILQRTMNRDMRFISAPQITLPLVLLTVVVLVTAKLTGGIGLHALGSPVMGGKKYVTLLAGILGYFALTARRIPHERANFYVGLFLLGGCVGALGDLIAFIPRSFYFIFLLIPPDAYAYNSSGSGMRFSGICWASTAVVYYLLARYGIHGIFRTGRPWRIVPLVLFTTLALFGGFRSAFLGIALIFSIQFFLEGLHRTKLLPIIAFAGVLAAVICFPLANRLPTTFQRALSFFPLNVDPVVRAEAEGSLNWRLDMWRALLPQVPDHLLLGKGYAITAADYQLMGRDAPIQSIDPAEQALAISGDYHNGPLSVILPFGIWGAIAFVWFIAAGWRVMLMNYRHGDPALRTINTTLFALFLSKVFGFIVIFGALSNDTATFGGVLGLSLALNGGICRPARNPAATTAELPARLPAPSRWRPAFQK
jgi:hypothetical protein